MFDSLILAFAFFLIIEGLFPAFFPNKWRNYLLKLLEQPLESIRIIGTLTILSGALILFFFL